MAPREIHQETSTNYGDIIATIGNTHRVINCRDNLQWIVQTWKGNRWRSQSYWRRRDNLIRHLGVKLDNDAREALAVLPRVHGMETEATCA